MKNLLIEEMKRAIYIMENKGKIKQYTEVKRPWGMSRELDRDISELKQLFLMIRKHSVELEKQAK